MTGLIFDMKRFAVHDGDGIRTTVFLKGCPLKCVWCHNPEGINFQPQLAFYGNKCVACGECGRVCGQKVHVFADGVHSLRRENCVACGKCAAACPTGALTFYGREVTVDQLLPLLLEDRDFYQASGGGVTLSGGECLMQADFCAELLKRLKENGLHTAVDTCGCVSAEALDRVIPCTDIFLYDIKAVDEAVHLRCTGRSNRRILENLKYLDSRGKKTEIRIPFVPEYNGGEIERIGEFLSGLKHVTGVKVLPYHNFAGSKYQALGVKNTLPERLPEEAELRNAKAVLARFVPVKE